MELSFSTEESDSYGYIKPATEPNSGTEESDSDTFGDFEGKDLLAITKKKKKKKKKYRPPTPTMGTSSGTDSPPFVGIPRYDIPQPDIQQSESESDANSVQRTWRELFWELILACQCIGMVYAGLSTAPLYVYTSTFRGKAQNHQNKEAIFGAFSLIFWTLTSIPLIMYTTIVLRADHDGEGGLFALYIQLCRHIQKSLRPNLQAVDNEISSYGSNLSATSSPMTRFIKKHQSLWTILLLMVLFGASMMICIGVTAPAISVQSSLLGLRFAEKKLPNGVLLLLACTMLVGLFLLQYHAADKIVYVSTPIVISWLIAILVVGLYNILHWNKSVWKAMSPHYIYNFFKAAGKDGCISIGGILLCITGSEAMFADLGNFTARQIRLAFIFVYPCLVVQYMGQAAFLSRNHESIQNIFYDSIPDTLFWPIFVIAIITAVVRSQAAIASTFWIIRQCQAMSCFPRVKVMHYKRHMHGQIYIPEINWMLMFLTVAVATGFQKTVIRQAHGLACMSVTFITTCLMMLIMSCNWNVNILRCAAFLIIFGSIESVFLLSIDTKVLQGGWPLLILSCIFVVIMYVWYYGTLKKCRSDRSRSIPWDRLDSYRITHLPGIGVIYSGMEMKPLRILKHLITNISACHKVLVLVCVSTADVPHVTMQEQFHIRGKFRRGYLMLQCSVRYGYKDVEIDNTDFENRLFQNIEEFIKQHTNTEPVGGEMAKQEGCGEEPSTSQPRKPRYPETPLFKQQPFFAVDELLVGKAKEEGVTYIMERSYVKALSSSSSLHKLAIDVVYSFLQKICREAATALDIDHIKLIEVGMVCNV